MNQQERDALREKHRDWSGHCPVCHTETACDVIKVLDALEAEVHDGSEVSTIREVCDHTDWTSNVYSEDIYADMGYRYCPKCGEKL
jgi:hypothetical protein